MVEAPIALYVHWPWCVRKCPYCDFNSRVGNYKREESRYIETLLADLEGVASQIHRPISSIYFGGGTPSLMSEEGLSNLLEGIYERFTVIDGAEVSLEANPGTVTKEKLQSFFKSGVTRLSIGAQSFNDEMLRALGRIHTSSEAKDAIKAASEIFDEVNIDLMYALPGQTQEMFEADLKEALSFATTHLSIYELTIEEGSVFFKKPPRGLPNSDRAFEMAERAFALTEKAGLNHYEVSGYAKTGHECRHNLTYWTYGDYLGIGAGAHAKVALNGKIFRRVRPLNPLRYMDETGANQDISSLYGSEVSREDIPFEFMLNVLRLKDGVPEERWQEATGLDFSVIADEVDALRQEGLLRKDRLATTELGWRFLNSVQERFLA